MKKITDQERTLISAIASRAHTLAAGLGNKYPLMDAQMDVHYCHTDACKLDLEKLAEAPDSDFAHDVFGIRNHLNRVTLELEDCFLPRCSAPEVQL